MSPEQKTALLSEYDVTIVVDGSGSMSTEDLPGGRSRWKGMQEFVGQIAREVNKIDTDGLDLVLFNKSKIQSKTGASPADIQSFLESANPSGGTPMAQALSEALTLAGKSDKKDLIVIFTDGEPDDKTAVAKVIKEQANRQEKDEDCTLLFVQIGYDKDATTFLEKLDDSLTGAKFDIVDVKTASQAEQFDSAADLLLAAIAG